MRMMHIRLPDFIKCLKNAAIKGNERKLPCEVIGLEGYAYGKPQSARTGVLQIAVEEMANRAGVEAVRINIVPRIPETMHTVVIQGFDENGKPLSAIVDAIDILHPTADVLVQDFPEVDDRRPKAGLQ